MGEFRVFCEKSHDAIDLEMLTALITEYSGTPISSTTVPESVKSTKAKRAKKVKTDEDACGFCRMPEPSPGKCMARSFGKGFGTQCTRTSKDGDYCGMHLKGLSEAGDPPMGRIDAPRRLMRADETTKECGWKHFKDDGSGVEDITDEAVGVGPNEDIQQVQESSVQEPSAPEGGQGSSVQESEPEGGQESSVQESEPEGGQESSVQESEPEGCQEEEDPDIDPNIDAPGPADTQEVLEDYVPAPKDSVPAPEDSVPAPEDSVPAPEDSVPAPEDFVPAPKDSVPVPEDSVPAPEDSVPAPEDSVPAPNESQENGHADSDSDTDDDEEPTTSKIGKYQGVSYTFVGTPTDMIMQSIPTKKEQKKGVRPGEVGIFDGQSVILHDSYEYTHDAHPLCDEDQEEEVIWE
jgi:hypothetical protein